METTMQAPAREWDLSEHLTLGDEGQCWITADETATWVAYVETAYSRNERPAPGYFWGIVALAADIEEKEGRAGLQEEAIAAAERAIAEMLSVDASPPRKATPRVVTTPSASWPHAP